MNTTTGKLTEAAIKNLNELADKFEHGPDYMTTTAMYSNDCERFGRMLNIEAGDALFLFDRSRKYNDMAAHIRQFIKERA